MEVEAPVIRLAIHEKRQFTGPSAPPQPQVPELDIHSSTLQKYFPVIYDQTVGREPGTRHVTLLAYTLRGFKFDHMRRLVSVAELYARAKREGATLDPIDWYDTEVETGCPSLAYGSTLHSELIPLLRVAQHYGFAEARLVLTQLVQRHYAAQHHWDRIVIALPWRDDFETNRDWLYATPNSFYDTAYAPYVGELRTINAELSGLDASLRFTIMRDYMTRRLGKTGRLCTGGSVSRPTFVLDEQRVYRVKYGNRQYEQVSEALVYEATGTTTNDPERDLILPARDSRVVSLCGDSKYYSLLLTPGGGDAALESDYYTLLSNISDATRVARQEVRMEVVTRDRIIGESPQYTVTASPISGLAALAHEPHHRPDVFEEASLDVRTISTCDTLMTMLNDTDEGANVRFTGVDLTHFTDVPFAAMKHQAVLVGCGRRYIAYVDLKGRLYIVGTLDDGKGEFGTTAADKAPVYTKFTRIEHEGRITMLSCGANHLMVVDAEGLWVMGRNDSGQLANNSPSSRGVIGEELKRVPTQGQVIDVSCGDHCSLLQTTTGVYYSSYLTRRWHLAAEYPVTLRKQEYAVLLKETETKTKPQEKEKKREKKREKKERAKKEKRRKQQAKHEKKEGKQQHQGDTKREASEEPDESVQPYTKKIRFTPSQEEDEGEEEGDTSPIELSSCFYCGADADGPHEMVHSGSLFFCDSICQSEFNVSIVATTTY